jgi:hypothetical protein
LEWREIARYAQAHPIPMKANTGQAAKFPEEDIAAFDAAIRAATPFRKLPRSTRIRANGDETDIYWGGALVGHRHVVVMTHPGSESGDTKFVAEDIVTYMND